LNFWNTLGIEPTNNKKAVKSAYAKKLKQHKPEQDPQGFQKIKEAFDQAIQYCKDYSDRPPPQADFYNEKNNEFEILNDEIISVTTDLKKTTEQTLPHTDDDSHDDLINHQKIISNVPPKSGRNNIFMENIVSEHDHLFSINDPTQAIKEFLKIINSEQMLNLKARRFFEQQCFHTAIEWNDSNSFPSILFEAIAIEFEWRDHTSNPLFFDDDMEYFCGRLAAGLEYQKLVTLANSSTRFNLSSKTRPIKVARLLLGRFRPKYFQWLAFTRSNRSQINKVIDLFSQKHSLNLCPEIDTKTFHWWKNKRHFHSYMIYHFLLGSFIAVILFDYLNHNKILTIPIYSYGITLATLSIILSLILWKLLQLAFFSWQSLKQTYIDQQHKLDNRPIFIILTIGYCLLLTIPAYIDEHFFPEIFIVISVIIISILLKEGVIFAGISTIIFYSIVNEANINLPPILNNLPILVGVASFYSLLICIRLLPDKITNIIFINDLFTLFFLIFISTLLSSIILNGLKILF